MILIEIFISTSQVYADFTYPEFFFTGTFIVEILLQNRICRLTNDTLAYNFDPQRVGFYRITIISFVLYLPKSVVLHYPYLLFEVAQMKD
jgi:hypothetical protein